MNFTQGEQSPIKKEKRKRMSRKANRQAREARQKAARATRVNETAVSQKAINTKLARWLEINDRDLCANHRKEVIDEEFQLFEDLMSMAPADPELELAMAHYKSHRVEGNLPYTGCFGEVAEIARQRSELSEAATI